LAKPSRSPGKQSGFSLIEMVVSLAIAAVILGTVYQVLTGSVLAVRNTENRLQALGAAQSRIAEAAAQQVLQPGTILGTNEGVAWSRSVRVVPGSRPTPETNLYEVTITATKQGSKVELKTLVIAREAHE
jgi:general secretion pathway protein I